MITRRTLSNERRWLTCGDGQRIRRGQRLVPTRSPPHRHSASAYARATAHEQCFKVIYITSAQPPSSIGPSRARAAGGISAEGSGLYQHSHRRPAATYGCATAFEQCFRVVAITSAQPPSAICPSRAPAACGVFAEGQGGRGGGGRIASPQFECFRPTNVTVVISMLKLVDPQSFIRF